MISRFIGLKFPDNIDRSSIRFIQSLMGASSSGVKGTTPLLSTEDHLSLALIKIYFLCFFLLFSERCLLGDMHFLWFLSRKALCRCLEWQRWISGSQSFFLVNFRLTNVKKMSFLLSALAEKIFIDIIYTKGFGERGFKLSFVSVTINSLANHRMDYLKPAHLAYINQFLRHKVVISGNIKQKLRYQLNFTSGFTLCSQWIKCLQTNANLMLIIKCLHDR